MRPIQVAVLLLAVLSGTQAESGGAAEVNVALGNNTQTANLTATTKSNNITEIIKDEFQLSTNGSAYPSQTSSQTGLSATTLYGPGIHAGFQASGPNFATSLSGGIKPSDGATLEMGVNFAGRFGDSGSTRSSAQQQPGNPRMRSERQQASQSSPIDGALFAVSYQPGLLSAIGNMLNPMRIIQQFGEALTGWTWTGFGQNNAMAQAQTQYSPPQASRQSNNGIGITWKPLYRAFW